MAKEEAEAGRDDAGLNVKKMSLGGKDAPLLRVLRRRTRV